MSIKVLITSAGSLVSVNILTALQDRRDGLYLIGLNSVANAAVFDFDKVYLTCKSALPPSLYADELLQIIKTESPDIIIPSRDIDTCILANLKSKIKNSTILVGEPTLALKIEDKWESYLFARKEEIPFAETLICKNSAFDKAKIFANNNKYPLIAKPIKGFASNKVSIINNEFQLKKALNDNELLLQEYLGDKTTILKFEQDLISNGIPLFYSFEEKKLSIQFFFNGKKDKVPCFVTEHVMINGVSAAVKMINQKPFEKLIASYEQCFLRNNWFGPLNIQLQKCSKTGQYKAYEFNGRFTGATAARYYLGFDELGYAFASARINLVKCNSFNSQDEVKKQPFVSNIPTEQKKALIKNSVWERQTQQ